jgi:hypothetical protein
MNETNDVPAIDESWLKRYATASLRRGLLPRLESGVAGRTIVAAQALELEPHRFMVLARGGAS